MKKFILSELALLQTPELPSVAAIVGSIKETNDKFTVSYHPFFGQIPVVTAENKPNNKLFQGIEWYEIKGELY